jgi:hypothetical protein
VVNQSFFFFIGIPAIDLRCVEKKTVFFLYGQYIPSGLTLEVGVRHEGDLKPYLAISRTHLHDNPDVLMKKSIHPENHSEEKHASMTICTTVYSINVFLSLWQESWSWNSQLGLEGDRTV